MAFCDTRETRYKPVRWSGRLCLVLVLSGSDLKGSTPYPIASIPKLESSQEGANREHVDANRIGPRKNPEPSDQNISKSDVNNRNSITGRVVSLRTKDSTIAYVVKELVRQANLRVLYDGSLPLFSKRIDTNISEVTILNALNSVLKGSGAQAMLAQDGQTIAIYTRKMSDPNGLTQVDTGRILGRVFDSATGKPLSSVTLKLNPANRTTISNSQGEFAFFDVPFGPQVVVAKIFGYRTATIHIRVAGKGDPVIRVVLPPVPTQLSGVVTTATGEQRKVEIGSDIVRINADSVMNVSPVSTITDLLTNRVPGLVVLPSSGLPGAPSRLRFRGGSSLSTSNDPIVFVDGVQIHANQSGNRIQGGGIDEDFIRNNPGFRGEIGGTRLGNWSGPSPLDLIDPASIETIEVFRGPSASAMYGAEAANGVIVITTKRGKTGPARLLIASTLGLSKLSGRWPTNYYAFGHNYRNGYSSSANGGSRLCDPYEICALDSIVAFQALNISGYSPLENGSTQAVSVSVSGGTSATNYSLTGSFDQRNGIYRLPVIEAIRFTTRHGFSPSAWMIQPDTYDTYSVNGTVGMGLGPSGGNVLLSNSIFYSLGLQPPDPNTLITKLSTMYLDADIAASQTPLFAYQKRIEMASLHTTNSATFDIRSISWLPLKVTAGLDHQATNLTSVLPRGYAGAGLMVGEQNIEGDTTGEYAMAKQSVMKQSANLSTLVRFSKIQLGIGLNYSKTNSDEINISSRDLPAGSMKPTVLYPIETGEVGVYEMGSQVSSDRSLFGWYVEPRIRLSERLFLNPGMRIDGSSAIGIRSNLIAAPKLNFSWIAVDRDEHHELLGFISQLRPRVGFGVASVQPNPGMALRLFRPEYSTNIGDLRSSPVTIISSIGNTKLLPEKSEELEGGFELSLWQSRATLTVSGYDKRRHNAIVLVEIAPSVGGFRTPTNVGLVRNRGINAAADVKIIEHRMITWSINAQLDNSQSLVMSVGHDRTQIEILSRTNGGGAILFRSGYPPNAIFVPRINSYYDANNDGKLTRNEVSVADDSVYVGAQEPTSQLNFSTNISFWNSRLQFSTAISYQNGMTQYNEIGANTIRSLSDPNVSLGRQAEIIAACGACVTNIATEPLSQVGAYQQVRLLRWTSLSIAYIAGARVTSWLGGSSIRVALQGSNLGMRTNYRGKDPSVSKYTDGNLSADNGQIPMPRQYQLRITWQ